MAKKSAFVHLICFFSLCVPAYNYAVVVKPLFKGSSIFEDMFRNLQHIVEDIPSNIPENNNVAVYDEPQNVFESNKIIDLPKGGQKIEKLVEKEYFDKSFKKQNVKRELTELYKFPNHTFRMIKKHGANLTEREESEITCIENKDCNKTAYCMKEIYKCQSCHEESRPCTESFHCCSDHTCDPLENICKKRKGHDYDVCESASDCKDGYCCALNDDGEGVCQPYLQVDEDCSKDPFEILLGSPFSSGKDDDPKNNLPSKCSCSPGLVCKKKSSFLFFESETCTRPEKTKPKNSMKIFKVQLRKLLPRKSQYHDEDKEFPKMPIPDFPDINTSFKRIMEKLNPSLRHHEKKSKSTSKTAKHVVAKKISEPKHPSIFDSKIHFNPSGFSAGLIKPNTNGIDSINSMGLDDDTDKLVEQQTDNNNLDAINDDNDDSDDDNDDDLMDNDDDLMDNDEKHDDKRDVAEKINKQAREATHKVVDGIFDSIMKGVIESMKDQA